jgi:hypothetical protein
MRFSSSLISAGLMNATYNATLIEKSSRCHARSFWARSSSDLTSSSVAKGPTLNVDSKQLAESELYDCQSVFHGGRAGMRTYNAGCGGESRITHTVGKTPMAPTNQYDVFRPATGYPALFVFSIQRGISV